MDIQNKAYNNKLNIFPDNVYFDGGIVSWNGIHNGNEATFGVIQPGFVSDEIKVDPRGEKITIWPNELYSTLGTISLAVKERSKISFLRGSTDDSAPQSYQLYPGETLQVGGGFMTSRIYIPNDYEVAYICEYTTEARQ